MPTKRHWGVCPPSAGGGDPEATEKWSPKGLNFGPPPPDALSNRCTPLDRLNPVFTKRPVRPGWKGDP
eukprot:scaffold2206_cov316-Pavlova_lutheri.AAC.15